MGRKVIVMNKHKNMKLLSNDMLFCAGGLVTGDSRSLRLMCGVGTKKRLQLTVIQASGHR